MQFKKDLRLEDFQEMRRLEQKFYDEDHIAPAEEAYSWYTNFPNYNAVLEDQGRIIGFLDLFPVDETVFQELKAGRFNDANLTVGSIVDVEALSAGDVMHMFLCCVVVEEEYRKTPALKMLFEEMTGYFETARKRGVKVDVIITDNVTEAGQRFSQRMGFEKVTDTLYDSVIYMKEYDAFLEELKKW